MSSRTRISHMIGAVAALTPDVSGSYPDQDGTLVTTSSTGGQLPEVLTFEAWMGGAGLSGTSDASVESGP